MLPTSDRTSSRQARARQPRDVGLPRALMRPGMSSRLRHALAIAGIPPGDVETTIHTTPDEIHVRLKQEAGVRELTLDQLATIAMILRAGEATTRLISAEVA